MANEKILNTRISLKYDTLTNWQNSAFNGTDASKYLKAGEVAIVTLAPNKEENPAATAGQHPLLFKVGTGNHKFDELPWVSGLAADVYAWAKSATKPTYTADEIEGLAAYIGGKVQDTDIDTRYDISQEDGELILYATTYTLGEAGERRAVGRYSVASQVDMGYVNSKIGAVENDLHDNYYTKTEAGKVFAPIDVDTGVHSVSLASGTNNGTVKLTVDGVDTDNIAVKGLGDAAYATIESLHGYADEAAASAAQDLEDQLGDLATKDSLSKSDVGLGNVDNTADINKPVSTPQAEAIAAALAEAKKYADDNDANNNTAHSHSAGAGLAITGDGGISGDVKYALNVAFELVDKTIKLYDKNDTNKTALATLDATEFIADGMLSSVEADQANNKLVFNWNTDAGITKTEISLSSIADIYTPATGATEVQVAISNTNVVSATLVNKGIATEKIADSAVTADKLAQTVKDDIADGVEAHGWGNHAKAGYLKEGDISGKADKVTGATNGNFAGLDANGNLTDSGKKASDFATSAENGAKALANENKAAINIINHAETGILAQAKKDSSDKVAVALAEAREYADGLAGNYATAAQGALAASALQEIEVGTGLTISKKAENKQTIEINTEVVFVLNCGSATEVI